MQKQRRDFLKITAAGAAGLALARADRAFAAWPSSGSLAVNPTISNMRVVACVDAKMLKTALTSMTFAAENTAVDSARVQANMDAMAMQLANETTADAAWKAIFRSSKPWASTKVAIKVNTIEPKNMARIAVVEKFCKIMAGFGVPGANIVIYDGNTTYGAGISNYTSYFSLTDTTKIQAVVSSYNTGMGGTTKANIPGGSSANCTADIANGVTDILINIANNKGHTLMGKATLSMKNHFGTFAPNHDNTYVFNINKSDAILGGTPVRQQLCFIDSIIANKASNTGTPEVAPCYLVMGVFGPAVDYLTVKKVREEVMGCTHDAATINSYMTTFGYATTDAVWVVVPPASGGTNADGGTGTGGAGGSGSAGGGGASGSGGTRTGGNSATGGAGTGGNSGPGGGNGGTSGSGGARTGGNSATGGSGSGGQVATGGNSATGGADNGGQIATGGSPGSGGIASGGAGGTTAGASSTSGGSPATGGTSARAGSAVSASGGSTGVAQTTGAPSGNSGGGCDIAGGGRKATGWGAMLAFGAVVAEKLRRLVSSDDRSS